MYYSSASVVHLASKEDSDLKDPIYITALMMCTDAKSTSADSALSKLCSNEDRIINHCVCECVSVPESSYLRDAISFFDWGSRLPPCPRGALGGELPRKQAVLFQSDGVSDFTYCKMF